LKKILFTAGIGNTDRINRWDFVLHLWERLAAVFETLGHHTVVAHHPCLQAVTHACIRAGVEEAAKIMRAFKPDLLFIWNGNSDGDEKILAAVEPLGIKSVYAELGWFPQAGHCYFDLEGVNAKSSLSRPDYSRPTDEQRKALEKFRGVYRMDKPPSTEAHHLIALQIETDSNIQNSRYVCMADFVFDALYAIGKTDLPILVRKHPGQPDVNLRDLDGFQFDRNPDSYASIMGAASVHAVNSTILLEAAMLGKRIYPYGRGIIHPQVGNVDGLLCALLERQLQWGELAMIERMKTYPVFQALDLG